MVLLHEIFGEDLAAFNDGGVCPGAKAGNAHLFQGIHTAQDQRIVRSHHGVVNFVLHGKFHNAVNIRSPDGNAGRVRGDASVSGQGKNFGNFRVLFQAADNGVLPPAAANDHKLHNVHLSFPCLPLGEGAAAAADEGTNTQQFLFNRGIVTEGNPWKGSHRCAMTTLP